MVIKPHTNNLSFFLILSLVTHGALLWATKGEAAGALNVTGSPFTLQLRTVSAPQLSPTLATSNASLNSSNIVTKATATKTITTANNPQKTPEPTLKKNTQQNKLPTTESSHKNLTHDHGSDTITTIHKASYRRMNPPTYPNRAYQLGQEGLVLLHAYISQNGLPQKIKLVESSGFKLLDKAALAAVKKWEFEPTSYNNQATASWVKVPVNFMIR